MIIDGHGHASGEYLNIKSIIPKLDKNNVDMVVLVPGELNSTKTYKMKKYKKEDEFSDVIFKTNKLIRVVIKLTNMKRIIKRGNEHVYSLKKTEPNRIKQFYWLTKKLWNQIDEDYNKMNFDGMKLHQCWEKFEVDSDWFKDVIKWSIHKNLPIFIHFYSHKDINEIIKVIKEYPDAKIIIAHYFGIELFMEEDIKYLSNIYFDISNYYFVSDVRILKAINHFGSNKILMGSDTPYGIDSLEKTIELVNKLDISTKDKSNILGDNLALLLSNKA